MSVGIYPFTALGSVSSILLAQGGYLQLGALIFNWGYATVDADGAAETPVTFGLKYTTQFFGGQVTVQGASGGGDGNIRVATYDTPTLTGMNLRVDGGPSNTTCTVFWFTYGF